MDAFARSRKKRRKWWNEHLWLQISMIAVAFIGLGLAYGLSVATVLVETVIFCAVVYVLARLFLHLHPDD